MSWNSVFFFFSNYEIGIRVKRNTDQDGGREKRVCLREFFSLRLENCIAQLYLEKMFVFSLRCTMHNLLGTEEDR